MKTISIEIDIKKIFADTGISKGKIYYSDTWGWVVSGHPDIDIVSIEPPLYKGIKPIKIIGNCWVYELKENKK